MGFGRLSALMLTALALAGASAHAQVASPRSGMSTSGDAANVNAYQEFAFFGRCFVSASRTRAYQLIALPSGSQEEATWFRTLFSGEQACLAPGDRTSAPLSFFRGVIAEALGRNPGDLPANLIQSSVTPDQVRSLPDVARCFVGGNREAATALMTTRLGSAEERAAVAAFWPNFQACMVRAPRARFTAPWIRFLVAEALLRMPQS